MKSLTFREGETVRFNKDTGITQKEAVAFSQLKNLPKKCLTVEHNRIRFGSFCGILRAGNVMIELLPKVEYCRNTDEQHSRNLFIQMLRATGEIRLKKVANAELSQQRTYLLDIFIIDFCDEVQQALRGGVISRYVEHTENLRTIRGRLHLTEHLRHNVFDESRVFCRFDEFTIDNPYNRILKGVLRRLFDYCLGMRARTTVTTLLHQFDEVSDYPVRAEDIDRLQFDRTNEHWKESFKRAKKLLEGFFPDIKTGDSSGSSLLFNMSQLFEDLLGARIRQRCRHSGLRAGLQGPPRYLAKRMTDSGFTTNAFKLHPDVTISDNKKFVSIFDAKWKRLDTTESNSGVSSSDAYQMAVYSGQYNCRDIALVYPASDKCPPQKVTTFKFNSPHDFTLSVITVDLNDLANCRGLATESGESSALEEFFRHSCGDYFVAA